MRHLAMRIATLTLALLVHSVPAGAQVTYRTGTPPPDALPPIEAPPAAVAPVPANQAAIPQDPRPVAPAPDEPDVNNPVKQTGEVLKDVAKRDVKALREGPLLIHGNYCGLGNRPGSPPMDALDEACMHHDACTVEGKLPNCACNNRLKADATRIAQDPATSAKIQALAATMAASMTILICK